MLTGGSRSSDHPSSGPPVLLLLHASHMPPSDATAADVCIMCHRRTKLTKLAANRNERRQLNTELQGLLQAEVLSKDAGSKDKQQHVEPDEGMLE